jgi:hypothetical protein
MKMDANWHLLITSHAVRFPEVTWDRFTVSREETEVTTTIYGWVARTDGQRDFILLKFTQHTGRGTYDLSFCTSSAKYSDDFAKRLEMGGHSPCLRVEAHFPRLKSVKLNA